MNTKKQQIDNLPHVIIYTDGACLGNPGPGGWAAVLKYKNISKEIKGGEDFTTNNKMELTALIKGLEALNKKCKVDIYTDSKYIYDAINKRWIDKWKQNKWKTSSKTDVKNRELWEKLIELLNKHDATIHWIKGHNGQKENEQCDELAKQEAKKRKNGTTVRKI